MIQDTFKTQLKQIQTVGEKVQSQLKPQIDKAALEGKKVLSQLGSSTAEDKTVAEVIAEIREHNPTLKRLILNLDSATYDTRKQLTWNATMMSAYAKLQAENKFNEDVKPLINEYLTSVDSKFKALVEKATELKGKVIS